jgi:hypothetical protein
MKTFKLAATAAALAILMSGAASAAPKTRAFTSDAAATADTSDPGSAPLASQDGGVVRHFSNDVAARANTADPGSAPLTQDLRPVRGPLDAAGRANTSDPG